MECEWMVYELQIHSYFADLSSWSIPFQLLSTSYIHCFRWQTDSNKHIFMMSRIIKTHKLPKALTISLPQYVVHPRVWQSASLCTESGHWKFLLKTSGGRIQNWVFKVSSQILKQTEMSPLMCSSQMTSATGRWETQKMKKTCSPQICCSGLIITHITSMLPPSDAKGKHLTSTGISLHQTTTSL